MIWHEHSRLEGSHALFSPSQPSWLNYEEDEQLYRKYKSSFSQAIGTYLHEYAKKRIENQMKLNRYEKNDVLLYLIEKNIPRDVVDMEFLYPNLVNYINDSIGYRMEAEKVLVYSPRFFGTADAISYKKDTGLIIHDLKTGTGSVHPEQLKIYAALFYLEYGKDLKLDPDNTETTLRIYQASEVNEIESDPEEIHEIMNRIIIFDKAMENMRNGLH